MAHHTLITRLTCMSAAAGAAVLLVIASAGANTAEETGATNVPASSVRLSPSGPSSGHSLTRLVELGVQIPSPDPHPAAKIASGHSLTRLVETGIQTPSRPSVHDAAPGREVHATAIEVRPVALGALGGIVLAGACALALRRQRTHHVA